jgi:hypothetical protein
MNRIVWISAGVLSVAALATSIGLGASSCAQTPPNNPVRSLVDSGRMDVLCFQVLTNSGTNVGTPIPAIPVTLDHCAPVPVGVDPTTVPFNLVALVTQRQHGELAAVNLTLGRVIDASRALPGLNFLPVGQNPTDVVITPDAQKVFVSAAETNKPAIYMLPTTQILGDSEVLAEPTQAAEQLQLPTWPVCALPQAPGRMVLVPTNATTSSDGSVQQGYEIVVSMPGNGVDEDALVGVIDTAAFDSIAPGSLEPCPITSTIHVAEAKSALPTSWTAGPAWPIGLPYVDSGVDLFAMPAAAGCSGSDCYAHTADAASPQPSLNMQLPLWQCPGLAHTPDSLDAGVATSALATTIGGQAHANAMATDGRYVWIGDDVMPFIHVIDATVAGTLKEIAPLVTSSLVDPSRVVTTGDIAVSPVTRDFKRYLYAVDNQGSLMAYDVTDPVNGPRTPLTRPNSELEPLQPPDRISTGGVVSTITFARHDFPIPAQTGGATQTGLLCNPNPNAGDVSDPNAVANNPGIEYRANGSVSVVLGPKRLRGVFAFATLANGQVVAIDVDDWDAPCRRPLVVTSAAQAGSIAIPEPSATSGSDVDPYHAPISGGTITTDGGTQWVSTETMWPIIQPNRVRSYNVIEDDLTGITGLHDPNVTTTPQLLINGSPASVAASNYTVMTAAMPEFYSTACITAVASGNADGGTCPVAPSPNATPNVFMAHDVPDVHVDQTWNIVYEGALPGFSGVAGNLTTTDNYATMTLSMPPGGSFCARGVEDQRLGLQRLVAMKVEDASIAKTKDDVSFVPVAFDQRVGDYVQFTDDLLGAPDASAGATIPTDDQWWHEDQACWNNVANGTLASSNGNATQSLATQRQATCIAKFGAYGADQNPQRDFPILEAYDGHVVLGRYDYLDPQNRPTNGRIIAPRDASVHEDFELAQCCFHDQAHFNVRTGAEWVALGGTTGYLHHIVPDPNAQNACVQSCNAQLVLASSRVPELAIATPTTKLMTPPNRNSPFALRNPAFSFYMPAPVVTGDAALTQYSTMVRDDTWQFSTRGQYTSQSVALTTSNTSVLPQSSMFVAPLGAIAIVDASANGIFIIDLNTLAVSDGSPFY